LSFRRYNKTIDGIETQLTNEISCAQRDLSSTNICVLKPDFDKSGSRSKQQQQETKGDTFY
jgi:hypothetical protein